MLVALAELALEAWAAAAVACFFLSLFWPDNVFHAQLRTHLFNGNTLGVVAS